MHFDFDTPIDRRNADSYKWQQFAAGDVIPMWVADMDFRSPPAVLDALRARVDHGVFGYAVPPTTTVDAVVAMLADDHGWTIDPDWLVWSPGLVVGLNVACRALSDDRPAVATTTPAYPPFRLAPRNTHRPLVEIPMVVEHDRYVLDLERAAEVLTDTVGLMILANPHNPTGRVFSKDELLALSDLCQRRGITLCLDEVHGDLILDNDKSHVTLAALSESIADQTISMFSPSKTYNLPGLLCGFAVIPNNKLRQQFKRASRGIITEISPLGYAACEAAYRHGGPWRAALLDYLRANRDRVASVIARIPEIQMHPVEATYLAWLDCRALKHDDPCGLFLDHGLALSNGLYFGAPGFVRLNFGCPRATLDRGLARLEQAVGSLKG